MFELCDGGPIVTGVEAAPRRPPLIAVMMKHPDTGAMRVMGEGGPVAGRFGASEQAASVDARLVQAAMA